MRSRVQRKCCPHQGGIRTTAEQLKEYKFQQTACLLWLYQKCIREAQHIDETELEFHKKIRNQYKLKLL